VQGGVGVSADVAPERGTMMVVNEPRNHEKLPAGTTGARPSYLRNERTSSLAVSWRGLLLAGLLFACLAVLIDFVL
jgi:hypothetical protein